MSEVQIGCIPKGSVAKLANIKHWFFDQDGWHQMPYQNPALRISPIMCRSLADLPSHWQAKKARDKMMKSLEPVEQRVPFEMRGPADAAIKIWAQKRFQ